MKHMELHIIQSVPVSCLNRDDLNSPKTAVFGGVQRARVSSQSWKRAIREMADKELDQDELFKGRRSRLFIKEISLKLEELGEDEKNSDALSQCAGHYLAKLDPKHEGQVKTLMFFSPYEFSIFADVLYSLETKQKIELVEAISRIDKSKLSDNEVDEIEEEPEKTPKNGEKKLSTKQFDKIVSKILKSPIQKAFKKTNGLPKDAADIALFGRMVASDHSLTVEAASMFSHALSIHKVDNEIDFFSAVDDLKPREDSDAGAAHTSTLEFNSATYYRFAALNLDMLADEDHLASMTKEERQSVVSTFVESTIKAIPGARKNTMNGNTLPVYVLGIIREKGHPIQLINAFEKPMRSTQGYTDKAVELLKEEYTKLNATWGIEDVFKDAIPDVSMKELIKGMVEHVV